ncbi:MAG: 2-C-methyl-D-erythritol 2,4-cyclodiphosphate synthase [Kiritimatiellae bacterium]|nr:2-C-methyl-D-erythritol 2,4-cyclodiphosphate synthase [Kiritimatiellia bacterium]
MFRTGIGFDSHRLCQGRRLIIGGVEISHEKGLMGHSDADVLCHAICDALLGAVADGDIGTHFPDTDPQWKGADSMLLLVAVVKRLHDKGWRVSNVDATIVAEQPKMAPYIPSMRTKLAKTLQVDLSAISIKAKTNEGMGFEGRGEGISTMAVVLVENRK